MKRIALLVLVALGVAGLSALGVWQIERRAWKLALIERVEQRVHAPAVPAPGPSEWAGVTRDSSEYRHVSVDGRFIQGRETLVKAVTDLGGGYWVLAPFQTDEGFVVLVNRGFVPPPARLPTEPSPRSHAGPTHSLTDPISITGLLRITEPNGGFLRKNDPARNQWYSRDVQAISHALGLTGTAPYFIDAEAPADTAPAGAGQVAANDRQPPADTGRSSPDTAQSPADTVRSPQNTERSAPDTARSSQNTERSAPETERLLPNTVRLSSDTARSESHAGKKTPDRRNANEPIPGLTVISFHNSHLIYAITWFSLALMVAALGFRMARHR